MVHIDLPRFYQPVKTEEFSCAVTAMFLEHELVRLGLFEFSFSAGAGKPRANFRKALASNVFTALTEIPNCFPIQQLTYPHGCHAEGRSPLAPVSLIPRRPVMRIPLRDTDFRPLS